MLANPGRHASETGGSPADHKLRAGEQGGLRLTLHEVEDPGQRITNLTKGC